VIPEEDHLVLKYFFEPDQLIILIITIIIIIKIIIITITTRSEFRAGRAPLVLGGHE